ncbi:MAG: hypothetical protein ACRC6U_00835 [Fusobacteriaceae bacterium]
MSVKNLMVVVRELENVVEVRELELKALKEQNPSTVEELKAQQIAIHEAEHDIKMHNEIILKTTKEIKAEAKQEMRLFHSEYSRRERTITEARELEGKDTLVAGIDGVLEIEKLMLEEVKALDSEFDIEYYKELADKYEAGYMPLKRSGGILPNTMDHELARMRTVLMWGRK